MARFAVCVALAGAAVAGCQPAKEVPDDLLTQTARSSPPAPAVPAASEPAAKEYAEKAVAKFTGGKPELVAKGRLSRATLKGSMFIQGGMQPATRTVTAVWPKQYFFANEHTVLGEKVSARAWLNRPQITIMQQNQELENFSRAEMERGLAADATAQHWMGLLVPLADPKAVVYDLQSATGTTPGTGKPLPIHTLKVSYGDLPVFRLTFDASNDRLVRVEYTLTAIGVRQDRQWTALDHKPGPDGQLLPTNTQFQQNGVNLETWTVEKWEFPDSIPESEFAPPPKK